MIKPYLGFRFKLKSNVNTSNWSPDFVRKIHKSKYLTITKVMEGDLFEIDKVYHIFLDSFEFFEPYRDKKQKLKLP